MSKLISNILKAEACFENENLKSSSEKERDGFFNLLSILDDDQQDLMVELLERFKKIDGTAKIASMMKKTLKQIIRDLPQIKKFYIFPLKKIGVGPKSSDFIAYHSHLISSEFGDDVGIYLMSTLGGFGSAAVRKKLLLVDDFIGTGTTASEAAADILLNINKLTTRSVNINKNDLIIFALVGQECGISKLRDEGYSVYVNEIHRKGISDYYMGSQKFDMIQRMRSIEELMNQEGKLAPNECFGREGSESLVSFLRCPNNTFPVFWFDRLYTGKEIRPFTFSRN